MNVSPAGSGSLILSNLSNDEVTVPTTYPESFTCFFISHTVSAQANAMPGYIFDHWMIEPTPEIFNSASNPASFVNNEPRKLTAYFEKAPLPTFEAEKITALAAKKMLDSRPDVLVIDVSQTTDFDTAHLVCAFNYPWVSGKFTEEYTNFIDYIDNDIIIYDQDGSASKTAADFLAENGFSAVYYMAGGLNSWRDSSYQVADSDCNCETCGLPPMAYAGSDQTVIEGNPVTLNSDGSSSPSGAIEAFYWEQIEGAQTILLSDNTSANPSFSAPYVQQGGDRLIFHLTVTDSQNNQDTDSVAIFVNWLNDPPIADAGPDQAIKMDQMVITDKTVILDGSGSSDPDGAIATYFWTIDAGSLEIELSNNNAAKPEFTAPNDSGWVRFLLTVTDSDGKTDTDSVTITINASSNTPPEANAGADQTIDEGETVQLDASESTDPDGSLTKYLWEQTSGPEVKLSDEFAVLPTFHIPEIEETTELVFLLTVEDNNGITDTDDVMVTVNNITDCSWNAVELDWNCPDKDEIDNEGIGDNDIIEPEETEPEKSDNGGGGSSCFISSSFD